MTLALSSQALGAMVAIINNDFRGDGDGQEQTALDCIGGWRFVLAGLKAWPERAVELNLVDDKWPDLAGCKGR
jgi:hypothetical protein